jgi:hypothetical protein
VCVEKAYFNINEPVADTKPGIYVKMFTSKDTRVHVLFVCLSIRLPLFHFSSHSATYHYCRFFLFQLKTLKQYESTAWRYYPSLPTSQCLDNIKPSRHQPNDHRIFQPLTGLKRAFPPPSTAPSTTPTTQTGPPTWQSLLFLGPANADCTRRRGVVNAYCQ